MHRDGQNILLSWLGAIELPTMPESGMVYLRLHIVMESNALARCCALVSSETESC